MEEAPSKPSFNRVGMVYDNDDPRMFGYKNKMPKESKAVEHTPDELEQMNPRERKMAELREKLVSSFQFLVFL
jgi:hypothetical protein